MALLILGHPDIEKSLANKTIIEELEKNSPDIEIRNLSALYPDYNINAEAEQKALLRHQSIVFQYPLYWYNMPAILKHWFDLVFTYQFAYGSKGDKLKGKTLFPALPSALRKANTTPWANIISGSMNSVKTLNRPLITPG